MDVLKSLLDLNILNIIDIVLVAILLYYIYKLLKGTVAINIFIGIVILYFFSFLVKNLEMRMLSIILGGFMSTGIIALIVLFQPEVRKFLLMLGSTNFGKKNKAFKRLQFLNGSTKKSRIRNYNCDCFFTGV